MTDYERYQLEWMIDHGHSLGELMTELTNLQNELEMTPGVNLTVADVFVTWDEDHGFGGEVWASEAEWRDAEGTKGAAMWDEGIEMAKTAYALDEALANGDTGRIIELAELLSHQVKDEVSGHAEAEGWYEEYDRATSAEHRKVETTVDPYGPAAFPLKVVPSEKTREGVTMSDSHKVSFDWDLIEKGLEQGLITTSVGDSALWVTINGYEFVAQEQGEFYVEKDDGDVSRNDIINSILDTLDLIEREPNDPFSASLIACVTYLNEHVDRSIESVSDLEVPTVSYKSDYTGETYMLALYTDRYQTGSNLALAALDLTEPIENDYVESWGTLSVNLPDDPVAASWCAQDGNIVLDTNNNSQALVDALVSANIIELTGESVRSGFCAYPLAKITPKAMDSLKSYPETVERILADIHETVMSPVDEDRDPGVSLKGEAEAMRDSASQLSGEDAPSDHAYDRQR